MDLLDALKQIAESRDDKDIIYDISKISILLDSLITKVAITAEEESENSVSASSLLHAVMGLVQKQEGIGVEFHKDGLLYGLSQVIGGKDSEMNKVAVNKLLNNGYEYINELVRKNNRKKQGLRSVFQFKIQFLIILLLTFVGSMIISTAVATTRRLETSYDQIVGQADKFERAMNFTVSDSSLGKFDDQLFLPVADFIPIENIGFKDGKNTYNFSIIADKDDNGQVVDFATLDGIVTLEGFYAGKKDAPPSLIQKDFSKSLSVFADPFC
ncbi:hypothetical protein FQA39_LY12797 [Lamprigera yunnana]|nr:hypothetical protein FQA39_LY12797 [Lamprigera yunnana]